MRPYRIAESKQSLVPITNLGNWRTLTNDEARGIIWLFEEPKPKGVYVVACDPAMGQEGWDRTIPSDAKTDNSAIEVFRLGSREKTVTDDKGKEKTIIIPTDYQVAEFAAPVDYEQCAAVINLLGRLFRGNGRMGVAHTIIEVYPGPGWMVEKTLIGKYGYLNFYQRKYVDTLLPQATKGIGWQATKQSVRDLWIHGTRHINNKNVVIRSPWLLDEMKTTDPIKFQTYTSEAQSGFKDDRLRAAMLGIWALHDFSSQIKVETVTTVEKNTKPVNWQSSDLSAEGLKDAWERRFREIGE
jgi:hypothetical protein